MVSLLHLISGMSCLVLEHIVSRLQYTIAVIFIYEHVFPSYWISLYCQICLIYIVFPRHGVADFFLIIEKQLRPQRCREEPKQSRVHLHGVVY